MRTGSVPIVVVAFLAAACAASDEQPAPETGATTSAQPSSTPQPSREGSTAAPGVRTGTVIKTASSEFGQMLFDRSGQAIYLFDKEKGSRAQCYGPCAEAWPPVLTEGEPRASGDTEPSLLGTTRRRDGSMQVTYAGHPLYFYAHEGRNQVLCHNVSEYGGLWLVVTPEGEPAP